VVRGSFLVYVTAEEVLRLGRVYSGVFMTVRYGDSLGARCPTGHEERTSLWTTSTFTAYRYLRSFLLPSLVRISVVDEAALVRMGWVNN